MNEFLASAIAVFVLAQQGVFSVGRRELRYMIEAAAKPVYTVQPLLGNPSLPECDALPVDPTLVPLSSVEVTDCLTIRMVCVCARGRCERHDDRHAPDRQ
jgi:hypothetical protein